MKTTSVLFIGNSYTYYNDMPKGIFEPLARAAGLPIEVTAITAGGYALSQYADPRDPYGALVDEALDRKSTRLNSSHVT